jgi:retron-type reverse transcriptase
VDGVTKAQYGQHLEAKLQDLHERLKTKRYRHQPIRRGYIPTAQGKTRPIGIAAFEDKLVQDAVRAVLAAPPARSDGLPQRCAARRGATRRGLDRQSRMGEAEDSGALPRCQRQKCVYTS